MSHKAVENLQGMIDVGRKYLRSKNYRQNIKNAKDVQQNI
jgi:hypothetical protein